jgi:hypothetical protein
MDSTALLFSSIPGLEGLIARPTEQPAAATPPRPPAAALSSDILPVGTPGAVDSYGSSNTFIGPVTSSTAPTAPQAARDARNSAAISMPANYGSIAADTRVKEEYQHQAISIFAEDNDSIVHLQRRIEFLRPGMTVSCFPIACCRRVIESSSMLAPRSLLATNAYKYLTSRFGSHTPHHAH